MKIETNYFKVPNCLMDIKGLTKNQILVLFSLFMTGSNGSPVYPSYKTIARRSRIDARTAKKVTKELENMYIVSVERRSRNNGGNYTNLYEINLDVLYSMPVYNKGKGGGHRPPGGDERPPGVVVSDHPIKNNIDKESYIKEYKHGNCKANNFSTCRPTENYDHLAVDLFADDT